MAESGLFESATGESSLRHLQVLTVIAESPRAVVYLAEWLTPAGGFVAVKRSRTRPVRSVRADASKVIELDHPRIAAVFDCGIDHGGYAFVVTEYVAGTPLTRYCEMTRLPVDDRIGLMGQLAETLEYVHARGLRHSNLKPSNVLASAAGITLLDFDVALPRDTPEHPGDLSSFGGLLEQVLADAAVEGGTADRLAETRALARAFAAETSDDALPAMCRDFARLAATGGAV